MNKFELIIFAILAVISVLVAFDFITYIFKSTPKRSMLSQRMWFLGFISIIAIVYWYMSGMRFL